MSKVDWAVAEAKYITKPQASYDWVAQMFDTTKITVVRHAKKRSWQQKRKKYTEDRIEELLRRSFEKRADVDERHLRALRITQYTFHKEIVRLGQKQANGDNIPSKEWSHLASLSNAIAKAIMTERTILGLSTKPIKVTDPEEIDRIQREKGYKTESLDQKYRETKALLEGIDIEAILKHKEILEDYVKKVEETGDYNVEHPLW